MIHELYFVIRHEGKLERIHRVVVAEGPQIRGIITTMDILRAIATASSEISV